MGMGMGNGNGDGKLEWEMGMDIESTPRLILLNASRSSNTM